jgi:hypothetical protein
MKPFLKLVVYVLYSWLILYSCKKEYSCEDCLQTNKPPIANGGPDFFLLLPVTNAMLDGNASSDPDGSIISFKWSKISGPPLFKIVRPQTAKTKIEDLTIGIYQFQLTVTDNGGLTANDTILVTVGTATTNQHPIAIAGLDEIKTLSSQNIRLDGSSSFDPDGTISAFQWTKISGPAVTITTPGASAATLSNFIVGDYLFKLTVTDNAGAMASDTVRLTIIKDDISGYEYSFETEWGFNDVGTDYDVYTATNGPNPDLFINDSMLLEVFIKLDTSSVWIPVHKALDPFTLSTGYSYRIIEQRLFIFAFFPGSAQLIGRKVSVRIKFL